MTKRGIGARLFAVAALVFTIGLIELAFDIGFGGAVPRWSPVTFIGAAFALGFAYLVGEVLWNPIGRILVDADKLTDPLWKRFFRVLLILAIFGAAIAGGTLAEQRGWLPAWR
jgi:hypothetical protein